MTAIATAALQVHYRSAEPRPMASRRLVCFPYAGAGASAYRLWPSGLSRSIEVLAAQLPGREDRLREAPARDWSSLVHAAVQGLAPHLGLPYALFGHSMGAALVVSIAREIERRGLRGPDHLFVSGRPAPGLVSRPSGPWSSLSDQEFLVELARRYGSLNGTLLDEPEVRDVVLPCLRTDIEALEGSAQERPLPISCSLTAYGGTEDPSTTAEGLEAWHSLTSGSFRVKLFRGGHFFLHERRGELLRDIEEALVRPIADRAAGARSLHSPMGS